MNRIKEWFAKRKQAKIDKQNAIVLAECGDAPCKDPHTHYYWTHLYPRSFPCPKCTALHAVQEETAKIDAIANAVVKKLEQIIKESK